MTNDAPADDAARTPRRGVLTLRHLTASDADRMVAWLSRPDVREDVGVRRAASREFTLSWIASATDDAGFRARAIELDGVHVGNVVLDRIDAEAGTARLSIYVGDSADRGSGVGTRAVRAMLAQAFDALGLRKVILTVHAENARAIRAYERAGFVREGRHRAEFRLRGRWIDLLYFGALKEEFRPDAP